MQQRGTAGKKGPAELLYHIIEDNIAEEEEICRQMHFKNFEAFTISLKDTTSFGCHSKSNFTQD